MKIILRITVFLLYFSYSMCKKYSDDYLYKQIPPINAIDNYDDCLYQNTHNTSGTFCFIYAEIKPNASSEIWKTIEERSRTERTRFRYDKLLRGVCLAKCLDSPKEESHEDISTNEPIEDKELLNFFKQIYGYQMYENIGYNSVVHTCLSREMRKNYNLRLRTNLLYCEHSKSNTANRYDNLDILGYTLISSIGIFVIFSSVYDHFLFKNQTSENWFHFYRKPFKSKGSTLLTSFSLIRNYAIFMTPLQGRTADDLKCFNFFRLIGAITVVVSHVLFNITLIVSNSKFVEENIFNGFHTVLMNTSVIMQMFFFMSAFLMNIRFLKSSKLTEKSSSKDCISVFIKEVTERYFRLIPTIALYTILNATVFPNLYNGPLWRYVTETERVACRENIWKNLLLINNFSLDKICGGHIWYAKTDMQLYTVFLIILILNARYPKLKKAIYSIIIILSTVIPIILNYVLKLRGVMSFTPETYRYSYYRDEITFLNIYTPFYTNIGGFIFGIISAELYVRWRDFRTEEQRKLPNLFWWALFLLLPTSIYLGGKFVNKEYELPSVALSLYIGLFRNGWTVVFALVVLGLCFKIGAYKFCRQPIIQLLAKTSFQVYIWHFVVIRYIFGSEQNFLHMTSFNIAKIILSAILYSNIIGFLAVLFVEYPFTIITYALTHPNKNT